MIRYFFILAVVIFGTQTSIASDLNWIKPEELRFSVGYPYLSIHSDRPEHTKDFLGISIGGIVRYEINEDSRLDIVIDVSYFPEREDLLVAPDSRVVEGTASIRTNHYSVLYSRKLFEFDHGNLWGSLGPTMGIQTIKFKSFKENNLGINTVNRFRTRNLGGRGGLTYSPKSSSLQYELAYYYLTQNQYSIIDDSSLDASIVRQDETVRDEPNWTIMASVTLLVF